MVAVAPWWMVVVVVLVGYSPYRAELNSQLGGGVVTLGMALVVSTCTDVVVVA